MSNSDGSASFILCPECDAGYPVEDYAKEPYELHGSMTCEDCGAKFEWYTLLHYYTNLIKDKKRDAKDV